MFFNFRYGVIFTELNETLFKTPNSFKDVVRNRGKNRIIFEVLSQLQGNPERKGYLSAEYYGDDYTISSNFDFGNLLNIHTFKLY